MIDSEQYFNITAFLRLLINELDRTSLIGFNTHDIYTTYKHMISFHQPNRPVTVNKTTHTYIQHIYVYTYVNIIKKLKKTKIIS